MKEYSLIPQSARDFMSLHAEYDCLWQSNGRQLVY